MTPGTIRITKRGQRKTLADGRIFHHGLSFGEEGQPPSYVFGIADDAQNQVTVKMHQDALVLLLIGWKITPEKLFQMTHAYMTKMLGGQPNGNG